MSSAYSSSESRTYLLKVSYLVWPLNFIINATENFPEIYTLVIKVRRAVCKETISQRSLIGNPSGGNLQDIAFAEDLRRLSLLLIEATADMASGQKTVRLKFGHDVNLLAIMHMMQVEELGIVPERLQDLSETWHCWMTSMAANLELFLYGNGKSILVLPYLNGEAVTFSGLEQVHGPFYRWEDVGSRIRDILRRS